VRYIIYGAGGIGGGIAGRLLQAGHNVVAIARGDHLSAIQNDGLRLRTPDDQWTAKLEAVGHPREIEWTADDVVLCTMKSQDTQAALQDLLAAAGHRVPVVCTQNGVENERLARRLFDSVYAMLVVMPATFLEPGLIDMHGTPHSGLLDAGRYPDGIDDTIAGLCTALSDSGFVSRPDARVMRLKYGKLLDNLSNAMQALCGPDAAKDSAYPEEGGQEFMLQLQQEALTCYNAAGIDYASQEEIGEMRRQVFSLGEIKGSIRGGGSTWQSFARGLPSIETDYLNGEITLLGALHGVLTPYNRILQTTTQQAHREGAAPGAYSVELLQALVDEAELLEELEL
jgi:2-dehydropantoate 2-reductase